MSLRDRSLPGYTGPTEYREPHILEDEDILGVHRMPSADEQAVIDEYRALYAAVFGYPPQGLHYIPGVPSRDVIHRVHPRPARAAPGYGPVFFPSAKAPSA